MHRSGGNKYKCKYKYKYKYTLKLSTGQVREGEGWVMPGQVLDRNTSYVICQFCQGQVWDAAKLLNSLSWLRNLKHALLVIKCHGHCQLFRLFSSCPHLKLVTGMPRLNLPSLHLKGIISLSFLPTKALCASRSVQGEWGCWALFPAVKGKCAAQHKAGLLDMHPPLKCWMRCLELVTVLIISACLET